MQVDTMLVAQMAGLSVLAALVAMLVLMRAGRPRLLIDDQSEKTVFLIERAEVLDATGTGRMVLDLLGETGWNADRLVQWLGAAFPGLPPAADALPSDRQRMFLGRDGISRLDVTPDGDRLRLTLTHSGHGRVAIDRICHDAARAELAALRKLADDMPQPVWRQTAEGTIDWANAAYLDLVRKVTGLEPAWPLQNVLGELAAAAGGTTRVEIGGAWFDLTLAGRGDGFLATLTPIDTLVEAESSLQAFKGTMSRTFAHLTVGLAIFDRARRLAVFNPALTDLTTLPVPLLVGRPSLDAFLDALRSRQMMPEPRDYATWRDQVASVESASRNGTYSELWHLPDGRTYRVTGRPQPDGAFALLMEDISAEISMTRSFRAEIAANHAVIDALPDAIAVFDRTGQMTLTNAAYDRLWGTRTQDGVGTAQLEDAVTFWRERCERGPLEDIVTGLPGARRTLETELRLDDGRRVVMSSTPLAGGSTMVRFAGRAAEISKLMPTRAYAVLEDRLKA